MCEIKDKLLLSNQRGMTLLELLLVVSIISAVAWMSIGMVSNNTQQVRFDDTRNRMHAIKFAIIGDTSRTINGHSEIRGYVADTGELPANLNALLSKDYCSDPQYTTQTDCTTAAATWHVGQAYAYVATYGIWSGWNGPYLNASAMVGYSRYSDGWGNDDGSNTFGWSYDLTTTPGALTVQSLGMDGAPGGSDYEGDYPPSTAAPLITATEYRTLITDSAGGGGITIDFGSPPATASFPSTGSLCLKIAYRNTGTITELVSSDNYSPAAWDGTSRINLFHFTSAASPPNDTYLPMGQMSYGVFEYNASGSPKCTNVKYPGTSSYKVFSNIPGVAQGALQWAVR